ncbi:hypothetical protein BpHYR1_001611 [Brachionus plicatilis]|uniref:Uncharacterized protein n=1 Tax=Brachionus plicatilis TaxID=10195 RepID=A0A3M7QA64_BRAPC|nr:hypothetical protein BpHYR1_001611 [Brachionus plicatilis]
MEICIYVLTLISQKSEVKSKFELLDKLAPMRVHMRRHSIRFAYASHQATTYGNQLTTSNLSEYYVASIQLNAV